MPTTDYIVFKQNDDGSWLASNPISAPTKDAAVAAIRTTAGTFVAITAQSFTPRTFAVPPRAPAAPKPTPVTEVQ